MLPGYCAQAITFSVFEPGPELDGGFLDVALPGRAAQRPIQGQPRMAVTRIRARPIPDEGAFIVLPPPLDNAAADHAVLG